MARIVVRYEGGRPVYEDIGPSRARVAGGALNRYTDTAATPAQYLVGGGTGNVPKSKADAAPTPARDRQARDRRYRLPVEREKREALLLRAVRRTDSLRAASRELGVTVTRIRQIVHEMRREDRLPKDVDRLLRSRGRARGEVAA